MSIDDFTVGFLPSADAGILAARPEEQARCENVLSALPYKFSSLAISALNLVWLAAPGISVASADINPRASVALAK